MCLFSKKATFAACGVALWLFASCKARAPADANLEGVKNAHLAIWKKPEIKVCWIDRGLGNEASIAVVESIVMKEYKRAGFRLQGWGKCRHDEKTGQKKENMIRILISDSRPFGRGCDLMGGEWCVLLNFTFATWPSKCDEAQKETKWGCRCKDQDYRKTCIQSYALHEFGHALGLAHEANHVENLKSGHCKDSDERDSDLQEVGPYDPDSVMNYCRNRDDVEQKRTPKLSDGDLATLRAIYSFL